MISISLPVIGGTGRGCSAASADHADAPGWSFDDPYEGDFHLFEGDEATHLYVADGSRIYALQPDVAALLRENGTLPAGRAETVLAALGIPLLNRVGDAPPEAMPVRSFSLAVAQKCNLGCTYCYAQEGDFGGAPSSMPLGTALAAVERLFEGTPAGGGRVSLAFLGGEPLMNREVVHAATLRAEELGRELGVPVAFSITTNGTLVTAEDGRFFDDHAFSVTISMDGDRAAHDDLRPYKNGRGSFDRIVANIRPLLEQQTKMQVSARVTVTPGNLRLRETLRELLALGFSSVGFSPMLSSPTGRGQLGRQELSKMLGQMIDCGREFERRVLAGDAFPFSNMENSLREIHRGTHRPYPCGAGGGYMGVSAEGELFACHRFVGDASGWMGDLGGGVDADRQREWLRARHVHQQTPCRTCWARYMCGGGCHHEVINRGRVMCEYVRGWLDYCLGAYARLSTQVPELFG